MTMPRMGKDGWSWRTLGRARPGGLLIAVFAFVLCQIFSCGPARATREQGQAEDVNPAERYVEAAQAPGRIHVVQADETLYSLAQKYYGSGQQYTRIYYANRNRLRNPRNLTVGMKLIIP